MPHKVVAISIAPYKDIISSIEQSMTVLAGLTVTNDHVFEFIIENAGRCIAYGQPLHDFAGEVAFTFGSGVETLILEAVDRDQLESSILALGEALCVEMLHKGLIDKDLNSLVEFLTRDELFIYVKPKPNVDIQLTNLVKQISDL